MIFFRDEIVEAGLGLEKSGIERPLRAIVRTQLELRIDRARLRRLKGGW
jgi:hypothetical protein